MKTKAFAKINLSLDVNGIDVNGYHTLESVFLPIDFYDVVDVNKANKMKYTCNKWFMLFNDNNTVVKAIKYMKNTYNIKDNFHIHIDKVIPTQSGLGGGSSDGAAVIRIINKMYKLNMSKEEIKHACTSVGSDVLFTYYNRPAYVKSIGDELTFINIKNNYYVLLVKPNFGISTEKSYNKLNMSICDHPNIKKLVRALNNGNSINSILGNSLEQPSIEIKQDIKKIKDLIIKIGGENAIMSGSGSCVFSISIDRKKIDRLAILMKRKGYFVRKARVIKKDFKN